MYERLRALREDRDLSQAQIARMLSVHQTTYSDYELGELNVPIVVLIQLAQFYKTSIDYIVGLTDQAELYPYIK